MASRANTRINNTYKLIFKDCFHFFSIGNYGEIIIKTPDEYWIAGKSSNDREFYVVIQDKNANLKDIAGTIDFYFILSHCDWYI